MMKRFGALLGVATMITGMSAAPVLADDAGFKTKQAGQILVRLRGLGVLPEDGSKITAYGADTGYTARVENNFIPELDLSYFITDNIAVEAIAGVTQHHISTGGAGKLNVGDVWLLPPTITAQYHFLTKQQVSPYVGVGINYTILFGESGKNGSPVQPVSYSNSIGPAFQAGVDIALTGNWSLNLDVKKILMSTDVKANIGTVPLKTSVDLNPWLVGIGVGYRF